LVPEIIIKTPIDPNIAKVGGLQSQGVKGEAVFEPTVRLRRNKTGSEILRLPRRVNNMAKTTPSFKFTIGDIQKMGISPGYRS